MKKLSFKEKLEIVRNIIRESLSGNAAFALLVYSLLHSLPAYFHERRSLNNFHRDRVITFEQIAE